MRSPHLGREEAPVCSEAAEFQIETATPSRAVPGASPKLAKTSRDDLIAMWRQARDNGVPGAELRLRALGAED